MSIVYTERELVVRMIQQRAAERESLANELHNVTAQCLFAITINLVRLQHQSPDLNEQSKALLLESRQLIDQALQEVRDLSYRLRAPLATYGDLTGSLPPE